ncbi:pantetheine-phosphate adenylyltransferase [Spiroplasma taiwanense]|uniref:Phosphopantetheine adenylyltransferase n=1 Tax=Spiroplasma taiwanense CT-1 TaxID=1276220 RepID=S5M0P2_9MOLU|nr:pantetheine-phosphate adenylyltransferase [Spiroplasma taiwanense]AGR41577.1 phosphopantetheine adenylyltransferase [Spiroplasma taiwanense CT-1]
MKRAIYPGSFNPFHEGHLNILKKASKLFDEIIIVVTKNINKDLEPDLQARVDLIEKMTKNINNKKIALNINQLTADFAKERNINYLIRGIRDIDTLDYEIQLYDGNKLIYPELETVFFISDLGSRKVSSTFLKEIENYKKDGKN